MLQVLNIQKRPKIIDKIYLSNSRSFRYGIKICQYSGNTQNRSKTFPANNLQATGNSVQLRLHKKISFGQTLPLSGIIMNRNFYLRCEITGYGK